MTQNPSQVDQHQVLSFGPFRLSATARSLHRDDVPVTLGSRALDILIALVERAGQVVSRRALIGLVWPDLVVEESNLRVHVTHLRRALGDGEGGHRYVANVPGRGYCFVAPVARMPPRNGPAPTRHRLYPTPRLERMVGRDHIVAELSRLLLRHRFISLVGAGGMGKTTVAVAVCHALVQEFADAVHFIDLCAISDASVIEETVRSALGISTEADVPLEDLAAQLGQRRALLVLDNCEHVVDTVALLAERIFSQVPQLFILATSREALRVEGEQLYLLTPLEAPPPGAPLTAADALTWPAVQLFVERAVASGHRRQLTDDEAPLVAGICRQLDGMALAIELAASRVGVHGIQGTAHLLENRFKLLWEGRRSALPRHQTMSAMLDWSYNLLSATEQRVLSRLSVFAGNFAADALHEVVADAETTRTEVIRTLASLIDKSLVWISTIDGATYHRLLDTTRAYAAFKLEQDNEQQAMARRHARYYVDLFQAQPAAPDGNGEGSAGKAHLGNVRAALEWCFSAAGDASTGVELAAWSASLFVELSLLGECRRWCELALGTMDEASRRSRTALALRKSLAVSLTFTKSKPEDIRAAIEHGLELARSVGTLLDQFYFLAGLSLFCIRMGELSEALAIAERAVDMAERTAHPGAAIAADWMLGQTLHFSGQQHRALQLCERAFERAVRLAPPTIRFFEYDHALRGLSLQARILWLRGRFERAERTARHALGEAERRADPVTRCSILLHTATVALWSADLVTARHRIELLLAHAQAHTLTPFHAVGMALKGELTLYLGDTATGVEILTGALEALHVQEHRTLIPSSQRALAAGLLALGQPQDAARLIQTAVADASARGGSYDFPELLRTQATILLAQPQPDPAGAEHALLAALASSRMQGAVSWELRTAMTLARLWASQERVPEAQALLGASLSKFPARSQAGCLREGFQLLQDIQRRPIRGATSKRLLPSP